MFLNSVTLFTQCYYDIYLFVMLMLKETDFGLVCQNRRSRRFVYFGITIKQKAILEKRQVYCFLKIRKILYIVT